MYIHQRMSTVQCYTTKRPQLCKFEVTVCKHVVLGVKRKPFWKLPCLTCKNDKASAKEGVGLYILSIYIHSQPSYMQLFGFKFHNCDYPNVLSSQKYLRIGLFGLYYLRLISSYKHRIRCFLFENQVKQILLMIAIFYR